MVAKDNSFFLKAILIMALMVIILLTQNVAAQSIKEDLQTGIIELITGIKGAGNPLFSALLGELENTEALFVKILVFLLTVLIIIAVLDTADLFAGKRWIQIGIGIIVAILGTRFLPSELVQQLTYPSSALVAVLTLGIPFVIFGVVINQFNNMYLRRVGWVVYAVLIATLWLFNSATRYTYWWFIYPLFVIVCIAAFIFDGTLQRWIGKARSQRAIEGVSDVSRHKIISDIDRLQNALGAATTAKEINKIRREIEIKRRALQAI